jgi:sensor c-di-GMP phosphodiesterase-like protein
VQPQFRLSDGKLIGGEALIRPPAGAPGLAVEIRLPRDGAG